jgi:hypothetical protein
LITTFDPWSCLGMGRFERMLGSGARGSGLDAGRQCESGEWGGTWAGVKETQTGGCRATTPIPPRAVDHPSTPSAVLLDDLHAFDPATMNWTLLSAALDVPRPFARYGHGFTSAGGKLYVHGGFGYQGACAR